jgi:Fe-S-cluster containining protein
MTEQAFFDQFCAVDYWEGDSPIFIVSPATTKCTPGKVFPYDPRGRCVLLKDGLCSIHAAKPAECRAEHHTDSGAAISTRHKAIAMAWKDHQGEPARLLQGEPKAAPFDPITALDLVFE